MTVAGGRNRKLLVGMHDGVCAIRSSDGGKSWSQGSVTPLAHAAARLTVSPGASQWRYFAAYKMGVYRTEDGGRAGEVLTPIPQRTPTASSCTQPTPMKSTWEASLPPCFVRTTEASPGKSAMVSGLCPSLRVGPFTGRAYPTCVTCAWHPTTRNISTLASKSEA